MPIKQYLVTIVSLALLAIVLPACSDDDGVAGADAAEADAPVADASVPDAVPGIDAHPADLTCAANDAGTPVVADPINIAGTVKSRGVGSSEVVVGATVDVRLLSDNSVIATSTTDDTGHYALSAASGGVAIAGYIHAAATGQVSTNLFTPGPVTGDIPNLGISMFAESLIPLLASFAGTELVPGDGVAVIQIEDCVGDAIEGASITVEGSTADTKIVYAGAGTPIPDSSLTATTSSGVIFIINLPPGDFVVQAHYGATPLETLQAAIRVLADEVSLALIIP